MSTPLQQCIDRRNNWKAGSLKQCFLSIFQVPFSHLRNKINTKQLTSSSIPCGSTTHPSRCTFLVFSLPPSSSFLNYMSSRISSEILTTYNSLLKKGNLHYKQLLVSRRESFLKDLFTVFIYE